MSESDDLTDLEKMAEHVGYARGVNEMKKIMAEKIAILQADRDQAFSDQDGWASKCRMAEADLAAFNESANIAQRRQMELEVAFKKLLEVTVCPSCAALAALSGKEVA